MQPHSGPVRLAIALLALLATQLASCAALEQLASGEPTGTAGSSAMPATSGTPTEAEPIPDPLHPTAHGAGETFRVADAEVTYVGVFATDGRLEVRFEVVSGSLPTDASVGTPDGEQLSLSDSGSTVASQPFGSASDPPTHDAILTLSVGDMLIPLKVGKVR